MTEKGDPPEQKWTSNAMWWMFMLGVIVTLLCVWPFNWRAAQDWCRYACPDDKDARADGFIMVFDCTCQNPKSALEIEEIDPRAKKKENN